jgi:hypothetical protein
VTEWSGVVETQYGTIVLAEPNSPPAEDLDFDRYWEEKCVVIPGGIQVSLPDQNGDVPTHIRILDESGPIEDVWEHVAEIGFHAQGGRIQVYSWMADEDLAGEIDVPTDPLVARLHWAGLDDWLRHVEAQQHEQAADDVRLRIDLFPGMLDAVRTVRSWPAWAPPIHESRGANGLLRYRGLAVAAHLPTLESMGRNFPHPSPTTDEGSVTSLLRDPESGSRWARGSGGSWSYAFLQELTPEEADALEAASYLPIESFARDAENRIWYAGQTPLEHAIALRYIPPDNWRSLEDLHRQYPQAGGYRLVDLPAGWSRITRLPFDGSTRHVVVTEIEGDGGDACYQRWPDGAEIPS